MLYILFRYLHFAALLVFAGALIIENLAISKTVSGEDARNLARVDAVYGFSALLVFVFGLVLWLWVGKPAAFYTGNPVFHAKLGVFALIALISIYPTVFFIRHRKSDQEAIAVSPWVTRLLRVELVLLLVVPILAFLMARGIGLAGMAEGDSVASTAEQAASRQISVEHLGQNSFPVTLDIVLVYDATVRNQLPFTQFDWFSRRDQVIEQFPDDLDVVSVTLEAGAEPVQLSLPARQASALAVLVFASHEDPVAEAVEITGDPRALLQIDAYGINVVSNSP